MWAGTGTIKIKSSMAFVAMTPMALMDNGNVIIDLRESGSDIYFLGGRITFRSWLANETYPGRLWFYNTDLIITSGFANIPTALLLFEGNVSITTITPLTLKTMLLTGFTKMTIYPGSEIHLNQMSIPFIGTRVEVRQSSLDFTSTSTALLRMVTPYAHNLQGTLAFDGKCKISSSTNNTLIFDKYAKLELLSGARLKLKQGTHLLVE